MTLNLNIETITIYTNFIKMFFMGLFTFYTYLKLSNNKVRITEVQLIGIAFISIIASVIRYQLNYFISTITFMFLLSILCSLENKNGLGYSMFMVVISYSINYIFLFAGILFTFVINMIKPIQSDYINLTIMLIIQAFLLYKFFKIKRIENGIPYLNKNAHNAFLDIIILNISVIISFSAIIFNNINIKVNRSLFLGVIMYIIIMFITIQKSIQLYYKQKLMIKELEETKSELEKKTQEVEALERENLEFSKKSHSLAHKQKSLEYKINQLTLQTEVADEIGLKEEVENVSKELFVAPMKTEITKTEIEEIDDMLATMQAECEKNNIDFSLQVNGNIHHMINNLISKEELAILLADHIKDAIIAINHSDNLNRTILVKLGKIDENYGVYIYDSGIEFEKETLENLGKKPVTTHKDEGGTGMGFMNTFDTLRKHNASLIINEIGKPSKENFTKVLEFKFDGKNEFKVESYR